MFDDLNTAKRKTWLNRTATKYPSPYERELKKAQKTDLVFYSIVTAVILLVLFFI